MDSRSRLLCAFACETPDRVPVAPFGFGRVDPDSLIGEQLIHKTDTIANCGGAGGWFWGTAVETSRVTEGRTTTTIYHPPAGDLEQVDRSTDITHATVRFPCRTADDVARVLSAPYEPVPPEPGDCRDLQRRSRCSGFRGASSALEHRGQQRSRSLLSARRDAFTPVPQSTVCRTPHPPCPIASCHAVPSCPPGSGPR